MTTKDPIFDIEHLDGFEKATSRAHAAVAALAAAGAPTALVEELADALQARGAWLVLARKARRDEEFYPYFPESYGPESDTYDFVAQLLATSALFTPLCGECNHPKGEHGDTECRLCGSLFMSPIAHKHGYLPTED